MAPPRKDGKRCTAKSKTTGERCKNPPIPGGTVCRYHGGAAPQVVAASARRVFEALVAPALIQYRDIIENPATPPHVRLAALRDLFDRTGYKPPTVIEGNVTMALVEAEIARLEAELEP